MGDRWVEVGVGFWGGWRRWLGWWLDDSQLAEEVWAGVVVDVVVGVVGVVVVGVVGVGTHQRRRYNQ
jgi:hypothetical protein